MTGCVLGLWRMSKAVYLLPLLLLALACGYTFNFWHFGLMMLVAIASAWIAWPMGLPTTHWRRRVAAYALLGFILVQISWELHAFWYDYKRPYSPDIAAARFLAPYVAAGTPMALTYVKTWSPEPKPDPRLPDNIGAFHSVGLYPYFSGPLFLNEPLPYWVWSTRLHRDSALYAAMRMHPPIVVAVYSDHTHEPFDPKRDMQRPRVQYLLHDGYRLTHVFCGAKPEDLSEREQICDLIFQP